MKKSTKRLLIILAVVIVIIAVVAIIFLMGGSGGPLPNQEIAAGTDYVEVAFQFNIQGGMASDQFAVWIEDMDGNYVRTLYATHFIATGGYNSREETTPVWVGKSKVASMSDDEVDAITGATPETGDVAFIWDLKNQAGDLVPRGEYKFFVEGTLRWSNSVLYSGVIDISGEAVTVLADAEYFYEESERIIAFGSSSDALTSTSPENAMLAAVTASFIPADSN